MSDILCFSELSSYMLKGCLFAVADLQGPVQQFANKTFDTNPPTPIDLTSSVLEKCKLGIYW